MPCRDFWVVNQINGKENLVNWLTATNVIVINMENEPAFYRIRQDITQKSYLELITCSDEAAEIVIAWRLLTNESDLSDYCHPMHSIGLDVAIAFRPLQSRFWLQVTGALREALRTVIIKKGPKRNPEKKMYEKTTALAVHRTLPGKVVGSNGSAVLKRTEKNACSQEDF